jgi:exonuclease VII large subunit
MEQILPDRFEAMMALDEMADRMRHRVRQVLGTEEELLRHLLDRLEQLSPVRRIALQLESVGQLQRSLTRQMHHILERKANERAPLIERMRMNQHHLLQKKAQALESLHAQLLSLKPEHKVRPGFVQLVKEGKVATLDEVAPGDRVALSDGRRLASATIDSVKDLV